MARAYHGSRKIRRTVVPAPGAVRSVFCFVGTPVPGRGILYEEGAPKDQVVIMTAQQDPLRVAAAVILGIITGGILFLIVALFIGVFNDMASMNISVTTNVAEDIFSAVLLVVLIGVCIAAFYWKVATTPPSEPETE